MRALLLAFAAYAGIRLLAVPAAPDASRGFVHDGAYMAIVAQNLLDGRGFVNDAHWLVFLMPESLPMPFHNGQPLYLVLAAGLAAATGQSPAVAGFYVSALANAALMLAVALLVYRVSGRRFDAVAIGLAVALFPGIAETSFWMSTDSLAAATFAGFVAAFVWARSPLGAAGSGVLLGLSWLTRSQVVVALPAFALYAVWRHGLAEGARRAAAALAAAAIVASPWLVHTAQVWGSPLRSDSSYYLLQDYHTERNPERYGGSVLRYWHDVDEPAGLGEVLRRDPLGLVDQELRGLPLLARKALAVWSMGLLSGAVALALCLLFALRERRVWLSPEVVCGALYVATLSAVFALRAASFEVRFFNTATAFVIGLAGLGALSAARDALDAARRTPLSLITAAAGACFFLALLPVRTVRLALFRTAPNPELIGYRALAAEVDRENAGNAPVVVGGAPYYYTQATGAPSLSIPTSSHEELLAYMDRYGARTLVLTEDELAFWRPEWSADRDPPGLARVRDFEGAYLWRRTEAP